MVCIVNLKHEPDALARASAWVAAKLARNR